MRYASTSVKRIWPRRLLFIAIAGILLVVGATIAVRYTYNENLKAVTAQQTQAELFTVDSGATVDEIAQKLQSAGLIRSAWAFKLYVSSKDVRDALQAGTYELAPTQSVAEIVAQLTHGKIATNLTTILPGQRIDQIKEKLMNDGFNETSVANALNAENYADNSALVDKPAGASLEGYLYPDSYQKTATTDPRIIIESALSEMNKRLTADMRSAFARQGLSTYQAIILASIVEREVSNTEDRAKVAQVFLKRLSINMKLQSDATASYGAVLAGQQPSLSYDSAYNTYMHAGLPPTPISNVSESSLKAVAYPANSDWIYFVSGDDGTTHFSSTLEEHESKVRQYCTKLCSL